MLYNYIIEGATMTPRPRQVTTKSQKLVPTFAHSSSPYIQQTLAEESLCGVELTTGNDAEEYAISVRTMTMCVLWYNNSFNC